MEAHLGILLDLDLEDGDESLLAIPSIGLVADDDLLLALANVLGVVLLIDHV